LDSNLPDEFSLALDPAVGALIIGCFALLFIVAASHKLRNMGDFRTIFAAYELSPAWLRWRLHWLVPVLEIAVAGGLLARPTRAAAACLGLALLIGYSIAISLNLRAGRTAIACGCGGPDRRSRIAPWMVWRNLALALLLAGALLPWSSRPLELTDALTLVLGLAALCALYSCTERLLGDAAPSPPRAPWEAPPRSLR
jgi:hypothetical protein